jgi:hypothetical protein
MFDFLRIHGDFSLHIRVSEMTKKIKWTIFKLTDISRKICTFPGLLGVYMYVIFMTTPLRTIPPLTFSPPASHRRDLQHTSFPGGISRKFTTKSHSVRKIRTE